MIVTFIAGACLDLSLAPVDSLLDGGGAAEGGETRDASRVFSSRFSSTRPTSVSELVTGRLISQYRLLLSLSGLIRPVLAPPTRLYAVHFAASSRKASATQRYYDGAVEEQQQQEGQGESYSRIGRQRQTPQTQTRQRSRVRCRRPKVSHHPALLPGSSQKMSCTDAL